MILVLNCGSQSVKWKIFDQKLVLSAAGQADVFELRNFEKVLAKEIQAIREIVKIPEIIKAIGHRVVHGGGVFTKPVKIGPSEAAKIKSFSKLAPLHNPYNIFGIKACTKAFPTAKQFAVFDTEFFSRLPEESKFYPLPAQFSKAGIKRFGFHGISHEYAAKEGAKTFRFDFENIKIITCHMGGGTSLAAIKNGSPIDTSMGFTPLEGPIMMTRPGSIDPGIIFYLSKFAKWRKNLEHAFQNEGGVKAVCGFSGMLDVLAAEEGGNKKANLALSMYVKSIKKYIGAYFAVLGGCDLLAFTGAIGYGSSKITSMILENMPMLKNTKIAFIKPDEELAVAHKIKNL